MPTLAFRRRHPRGASRISACALAVGSLLAACADRGEPRIAARPANAPDGAKERWTPPATRVTAADSAPPDDARGLRVEVDCGPGTPWVVVFLPAGDGLERGAHGMRGWPLLWHLRDLGVSVLAADAGADDAAELFHAAAERAGGPSRVAVIAVGAAIPAALALLGSDRAPAGIAFTAPRAADLDAIARGCANSGAPCSVAFGGRGVAQDTIDEIARAVARHAGRVLLDGSATPDAVLARAHGILEHERSLLSRVFPGELVQDGDLYARRVFDTPEEFRAAQALAMEREPWREALVMAWLRRLPPGALEGLRDDAFAALLDFTDPSGLQELAELGPLGDVVDEVRGRTPTPALLPEALAAAARDLRLGRKTTYCVMHPWSTEPVATRSWDLAAGPAPYATPPRLVLPEPKSERMALRLLLKAAGIPDRVLGGPTDARIEVFQDGRWRALGTASAPPP